MRILGAQFSRCFLDIRSEGPDILKSAARRSRELDVALSTWGDVTFTYESTDTPDLVVTPS